ncbi:MAG: hypothetical protein JST81_10655 [Bacteroidetes bacterium]|nr:hypothetical protein [Bacteroidota bacterium]
MKKIIQLIDKLDSLSENAATVNTSISKVPVAWHIEHVLMATILIIDQLHKSDPSLYKWKFNKNRFLVFCLNRIPRGKATAPTVVMPKNNISMGRLKKLIEIAREKAETTDQLQSNQFIVHPHLGMLNVSGARKFMCIHLAHHIKIIRDIAR